MSTSVTAKYGLGQEVLFYLAGKRERNMGAIKQTL
jgi:hypothetical protein